MLTEKQVLEIREHLERAQNPIFFFDNDQDGLCSFLLLQRYSEKGKGIPIKSFPELTAEYFRRVGELNADYIFVLDKPIISEDFLNEARQVKLPIVWIDHHHVEDLKIPEGVFYYNPVWGNKKNNEPVSALCYQVCHKKEDLWISFVGCISDAHIPDFYDEFKEKYPDLLSDSADDALDIFYSSEIGKVAQIFGAGLKDKTTNVINMLRFLAKVKTPYEVLEENSKNYFMHKRFSEIDRKYKKLIGDAVKIPPDSDEILFFEYGGELSISSELANGLKHKFPKKFIVVGYLSGAKINISIRGKNVRKIILEVVKKIDGATGGGHEDAVGAKVNSKYWELFKKEFEKQVLDKNND